VHQPQKFPDANNIHDEIEEFYFKNTQPKIIILTPRIKLMGCNKLQDYCLESICEDPEPFITSKKFHSLDKDILYNLLKRDDFSVEEAIIWDCLIKWGIEQIPGLRKKNSDRTKWNNSNYQALKKTLNPFIPLIRFTEFTSAKYFDKIRPYKPIIPNNIYDEIEEYYFKDVQPKTINLTPRIKKFIESKLIKPKLVNIIASWIERKDEKNLSVKYKFNLLYRSSQDGLNINTFQTKCNNQGPCLILVKHQRSAKIYGGYNQIGFVNNTSGQYYNTTESFIFSFENSEDILNMKISHMNGRFAIYAINEYYTNGFNFGNTFYLHGSQKIFFNHPGNYDDNINYVLSPYLTAADNYFVPVELEVFKINTL
jgi:hypothetical protein